jgi:two-component system phosphate regulon response regulator PhoB
VAAAGILVVEDEPDLGALLEYVLGREGFEVALVRTGHEALGRVRQRVPELMILDLMLPDVDGMEVLREVKRSGAATGVIILSAKKSEVDRVRGLELGADDYVVKPFSPRELVLRVQTVLRRDKSTAAESEAQRLRAGPIAIDLDHHEVRVAGELVHLTLTEFRLLAALVRNEGRVRSRESLLTEVWGYDAEAMSRTVDTHVRRLRDKLGSASKWLGTVRGVGYRVRDPDSDG